MLTRMYTGLWSKYRPAILKMMVDSDREPQTYQMSNHEFLSLNKKKKTIPVFAIEIKNGKVVSGMKDSMVAQDLWLILQQSPKASELISTAAFHFAMDRQFVLHVHRKNIEN